MEFKSIAKTAGIALVVVYAYHSGLLNFVPMFKDTKKVG